MNKFEILKEAVDLAEWVEQQGGHLFINYQPHVKYIDVRLYPEGWASDGSLWSLELNDLGCRDFEIRHITYLAEGPRTTHIKANMSVVAKFEFIKDIMRYGEEEATMRLEEGYYNEKF